MFKRPQPPAPEPTDLSRYITRLALVERDDGKEFRGHITHVADDHILLRAAEWLDPTSGEVVARSLPGEYIILTARISGIQLPPTA